MSDGNFFSPFSRLLSSFLSFLFFDPPRRLNIESSSQFVKHFMKFRENFATSEEFLNFLRNFLFFFKLTIKIFAS